MNVLGLKTALEETGYPVTYSHFEYKVDPPYIAFIELPSSNFSADDGLFLEILNVQIELYTLEKDPVAEEKVKEVLKTYLIPFDTDEDYIESEKLFQKIFEVRLI